MPTIRLNFQKEQDLASEFISLGAPSPWGFPQQRSCSFFSECRISYRLWKYFIYGVYLTFVFGINAEKSENCETHFPRTGEIPQVWKMSFPQCWGKPRVLGAPRLFIFLFFRVSVFLWARALLYNFHDYFIHSLSKMFQNSQNLPDLIEDLYCCFFSAKSL